MCCSTSARLCPSSPSRLQRADGSTSSLRCGGCARTSLGRRHCTGRGRRYTHLCPRAPRLLRALPRVRKLQVPEHDAVGALAWCAAGDAPHLEDLTLSLRHCQVMMPMVLGRVLRALARLMTGCPRLQALSLSLRIPLRLPVEEWLALTGCIGDRERLRFLHLSMFFVDPAAFLAAASPLPSRGLRSLQNLRLLIETNAAMSLTGSAPGLPPCKQARCLSAVWRMAADGQAAGSGVPSRPFDIGRIPPDRTSGGVCGCGWRWSTVPA